MTESVCSDRNTVRAIGTDSGNIRKSSAIVSARLLTRLLNCLPALALGLFFFTYPLQASASLPDNTVKTLGSMLGRDPQKEEAAKQRLRRMRFLTRDGEWRDKKTRWTGRYLQVDVVRENRLAVSVGDATNVSDAPDAPTSYTREPACVSYLTLAEAKRLSQALRQMLYRVNRTGPIALGDRPLVWKGPSLLEVRYSDSLSGSAPLFIVIAGGTSGRKQSGFWGIDDLRQFKGLVDKGITRLATDRVTGVSDREGSAKWRLTEIQSARHKETRP